MEFFLFVEEIMLVFELDFSELGGIYLIEEFMLLIDLFGRWFISLGFIKFDDFKIKVFFWVFLELRRFFLLECELGLLN